MRIRKNASLSSLIVSNGCGADGLHTHVCQLNQSPWDVISFTPETDLSFLYQLEGEDSLNVNGGLGDSICAVESDGMGMSVMKVEEEKTIVDNNNGIAKKRVLDHHDERKTVKKFKFKKGECNKSDEKCGHCKKEGHSKCLNSYANNHESSAAAAAATSEKAKRAKVKGKKGSSASSNPYEFYYYSGFGPRWGKRRGIKGEANRNIVNNNNNGNGTSQNTTLSPVSSSIERNEEFDCVEDDDDDDEEENDRCRKRMRKPVKARSLKSLM